MSLYLILTAFSDQALTTTIEDWAKAVSTLYSDITKPLLDVALLSYRLTALLGVEGAYSVFFFFRVYLSALSFPRTWWIWVEGRGWRKGSAADPDGHPKVLTNSLILVDMCLDGKFPTNPGYPGQARPGQIRAQAHRVILYLVRILHSSYFSLPWRAVFSQMDESFGHGNSIAIWW